jgi:molybdopterin adenylyltransferase
MSTPKFMVGRITLSDRAAAGIYEDASGPEIERVLRGFFEEEMEFHAPAERDVTPEATRAVIEKELPGFGEVMRMKSFENVPTAVLSRSVAGVAGRSLIVNLPGRPAAIGECLALLAPAIAECLDHVAGWRPRLVAGRHAR